VNDTNMFALGMIEIGAPERGDEGPGSCSAMHACKHTLDTPSTSFGLVDVDYQYIINLQASMVQHWYLEAIFHAADMSGATAQ
jgi:hypothetical protein